MNLGPAIGQIEVINYINFTSGLLTQKIAAFKQCKQIETGLSYNIKDQISQIRDPNSGVSEYLGLDSLPWTGDFKLHHLKVQFKNSTDQTIQHIYFCPKTLNLKYMFVDGQEI